MGVVTLVIVVAGGLALLVTITDFEVAAAAPERALAVVRIGAAADDDDRGLRLLPITNKDFNKYK